MTTLVAIGASIEDQVHPASTLMSASSETGGGRVDGRVAATVVVLVMLWIAIRMVAAALIAVLAAAAKLAGLLAVITVLFAIVSLILAAQLGGSAAVRHAQEPDTAAVADTGAERLVDAAHEFARPFSEPVEGAVGFSPPAQAPSCGSCTSPLTTRPSARASRGGQAT